MADSVQELREKVTLSCRILAMMGLVRDITGHVSARVPDAPDEMLLRCRGVDEYGLAATSVSQVRRMTFDGQGGDLDADHERPLELPIHGEVLRARPEVGCVIHAHPTGVLMCGLAGIDLRPIVGAYDPGAMQLALAGIPVYPRSILISRPELGRELAAALGDKSVCFMRGHGFTVTGTTVEQATIRAVKVEALARIMWQLKIAGVTPANISDDDIAAFRSGGPGAGLVRADEWTWKAYVKQLEDGKPLPPDVAIGVETV
ncbi:MAG: hypothetical protein QOF51_1033 [Chloroflexota bacterium]|nr:hypothetical protein [Chloroflexota bacterium]